MAFSNKRFEDKETSYEVPRWRQIIEQIESEIDTFSFEEEKKKQRRIKENEVGIKHPTNGSFIKIKDDGSIEMFAGEGAGLRLSPDETVSIFGDIQLIGNKFQGITPVNNVDFNDVQLTGEFPNLEEKGQTESFKELKKRLEGE